MLRNSCYALAFLMSFGTIADAQNTVTTGAGTTNSVPKFSGSTTLTNSAITELNGNVGIGTGNPLYLLDVNGTIGIKGVPVVDKTTISTPTDGTYVIASGARVHGEYIMSWESPYRLQTVHLLIAAGQYDDGSTIQILDNHPYTGNTVMSNFRLLLSSDRSVTYLVMDVADRSGGTSVNVQYHGVGRFGANFGGTLAGNETATGSIGLAIRDTYIGIGTATPSAKLDIVGNVKLSGGGSSITFPDGTVQSTAWNGTLSGGDYAESVDVSGSRSQYEPGDLLAISDGDSADVIKSSAPYSTLVVGVYSTKPGIVGRRQLGETTGREIPMAMVGIVPLKVSAENGAIRKGDPLVSSSLAGYAMKGTDHERMFNAVVGKALGSLDSGTGVIEAVISLQ